MADNNDGRPPVTDEQYEKWLDDMRPFLKLGETLYHAIESAELEKHQTSIYKKYKLGDWFAKKIDNYRSYPAKLTNDIFTKILGDAHEKIKQGKPVDEDTMKNIRFFAEKSRSNQTYFVNRTETAEAKPVDDILDELESGETVDDVAENIAKEQTQDAPVPSLEGLTITTDQQPPSDATQ